MHTYRKLSPIEPNSTYFLVNMKRIALRISVYPSDIYQSNIQTSVRYQSTTRMHGMNIYVIQGRTHNNKHMQFHMFRVHTAYPHLGHAKFITKPHASMYTTISKCPSASHPRA